ncbi:retrotransposable element Tf2 [Tanacetum coccineum]
MVLKGDPKTTLQWIEGKHQEREVEGVPHTKLLRLSVFPNTGIQLMSMQNELQFVPKELQQVVDQYDDVFAVNKELPPQRSYDHIILLFEGTQPVNIRPYKHPPTQKDAIKAMVRELLEAGLNKNTAKGKFPIPIIKELIDELHGATIFSKFDLRYGYHQIRMCEEDIAKTAFKTHEGHYEFLVMPFGLTNAPFTFQALMNEVFKAFLRKFTLPIPSTLKQLRGFLGLTGYYKRFIKHFASLSKPLTQLLKKNAFKWAQEAQLSFEALKKAMMEAPVLGLLDFNEPFVIETYASGVGLGALLQQKGHPNAYLSKTLSPKHQSWSTYEKEFLAVLMALEKWRRYLLDRHFIIKTGHFSLQYLMDQRITTPTQMKWLPKLMRYDYEVVSYKKGLGNGAVDALSRLRSGAELLSMFVSTVTIEKICLYLSAYLGLLQPLPIPQTIWSQISMDFIEGLPKSYEKVVIMVVVDRLSKYAYFTGLSHPFNVAQIAQKELFRALKVKLHMSTAYHPQTDGQTEVVNRCLEGYLRCMSGEQPNKWFEWLPLAELCKAGAMDMTLLAREEAIQVLKFHLQRSQNRMKQQDDKSRYKREFDVGDMVFLKLKSHRQVTIRMGKQNKFSQKFYGHF